MSFCKTIVETGTIPEVIRHLLRQIAATYKYTVQLYNKLYLYTIGLHTDKHIMQEHIKGPYSEILQKHKKTIPHKKRNLKKYL